jgi:hypothetical protein
VVYNPRYQKAAAIIERLDTLAENDEALKASVDELRTLITQVLKNQQKGE